MKRLPRNRRWKALAPVRRYTWLPEHKRELVSFTGSIRKAQSRNTGLTESMWRILKVSTSWFLLRNRFVSHLLGILLIVMLILISAFLAHVEFRLGKNNTLMIWVLSDIGLPRK